MLASYIHDNDNDKLVVAVTNILHDSGADFRSFSVEGNSDWQVVLSGRSSYVVQRLLVILITHIDNS